MAAKQITHKVHSRLLGMDYQYNLVMRGRYIYWGDDTGPYPSGIFDLSTGGSGGGTPLNSITATIPAGIVDNYQPAGWSTGVTNRLILTPTDSTSIIVGFPLGGDDWPMELFCHPLSSLPVRIQNGSSGTSGNSIFNGQGGTGIVDVLPGTGVTLVAIPSVNGWCMRGG